MSPGNEKCKIFGICLHSRWSEKALEEAEPPESNKALRSFLGRYGCMESKIH